MLLFYLRNYILPNHSMSLLFVGQPILGWECSATLPQTSKHDLWPFVRPIRCSSGDEIVFIEGLQTLAVYLQVNDHTVHQFFVFFLNTGWITTKSLGMIPGFDIFTKTFIRLGRADYFLIQGRNFFLLPQLHKSRTIKTAEIELRLAAKKGIEA